MILKISGIYFIIHKKYFSLLQKQNILKEKNTVALSFISGKL